VPASFDPARIRGVVDGVHFRGGPPPPADVHAAGATLRERLGLTRPENRYAIARRTA
jgi:phage terminase large subunit-like protein